MTGDGASGGQLDELAGFALEHAHDRLADGGRGAAAVFLFADDVEDRYLYTFAEPAEARLHLADPAHGYLRCALAWSPGPGVCSVQAQELGSRTSFVLTRRTPLGKTVRTGGAGPLLPAPRLPGDVHSEADTEAGQAEIQEIEDEVERAVESGAGLSEAEARVRRWIGRAGEAEWAAAEKWVRRRLPADPSEHEGADEAVPEEDRAGLGARTPGRYVITFHQGGPATGPEAALATWDQVARRARELLGPDTTSAAAGTALEDPADGLRLALCRDSGAYELSAPLQDGAAPVPAVLERLYELALTVQLESGRRAVDPQVGWYIDRAAGATWSRRLRLFFRAARPSRPDRP
ncbi:hypothetical protein AB0D54_10930 [Streptomyces xanthophaeus]|uniref:hypothetical protein n=1 Tax=Streptomyces xanthophaeus TaxID=67385 RepID=UPI003417A4BE